MRKVAINRRVFFDYEALETLEAGIALKGTEVKSLRFCNGDISNSYCTREYNKLMIGGFLIPKYSHASVSNHEPKRPKQLLLRENQLFKVFSSLDTKGLSVVPIEVYFNDRGWLKAKIAVVRGKKKYDKRRDLKEKEWERRKQRLS